MKLFEILNEAKLAKVAAGAATQNAVWADLQSKFGDDVEMVSMAKESSSKADLVCKIHGQRVQFEIKGRQNATRWNTAMDLRMGGAASGHDESGNVPGKLAIINKAINIITGGHFSNLRDYIQFHQKEHKKVVRRKGQESTAKPGFAGDDGVAPSGQFSIKAPPETIGKFVPIFRELWKASGDDYIATMMDNKITYYKISGINVVPGAKNTLPITAVQLETAGGAVHNKTHDIVTTRVGLKFQM